MNFDFDDVKAGWVLSGVSSHFGIKFHKDREEEVIAFCEQNNLVIFGMGGDVHTPNRIIFTVLNTNHDSIIAYEEAHNGN